MWHISDPCLSLGQSHTPELSAFRVTTRSSFEAVRFESFVIYRLGLTTAWLIYWDLHISFAKTCIRLHGDSARSVEAPGQSFGRLIICR